MFDKERLEPPKGKARKKEKKRTHRPLLFTTFAIAPEKGGEEPDELRVKGGISDQAGRHLAFSEASITHMFFPTVGKLNLSISFVDSPFPKHQPLFAYFTYTREEDTGVCKQTYGESYIAVNLTFGLPSLYRTGVCMLVSRRSDVHELSEAPMGLKNKC